MRRQEHRHLLYLLSAHKYSNKYLPRWLQFSTSYRRIGTKLLPYMIIILVACIFQFDFSIIYKIILIIALFLITRGYIM